MFADMILSIVVSYAFLKEPVMFNGEGEYNINGLKEMKVTDSFLDLDQGTRKCQNEEPFHNCTTKRYNNAYIEQCGCLPFNIKRSKEVSTHDNNEVWSLQFL